MQKKIIALAVAGLVSGGAFAQSNVTISGQMKLGVEAVSAGGATGQNQDMTSRTRVTDNNSFLRFAGEEKLGNGMTAWFQVESAIGTSDNTGTTGAQAGANSAGIGTRNTAVGLKGNFGNIFFGKWDAYYNTLGGVDPTGLADGNGMATSSLNILHTQGSAVNNTATGNAAAGVYNFGGRFNNSIVYQTPMWNGFQGTINYSVGGISNTSTSGAENTVPQLAAKDSMYALNPTWSNGPIMLFAAHIKVSHFGATTATTAGASGSDATASRVGGAYSFPMGLKIGLIWDRSKVETSDGSNGLAGLGGTANGNTGFVGVHSYRERDAWALPLQYMTGAHKFNFTYAQSQDTDTSAGTVQDSGAKMYMLAYQYNMSKRTNIATSYMMINNGRNGAYDGWHPSNNIGGSSSNFANAGLSAGADPRIFQVNLNHSF